jgi:hypothetical protein
LAKSEPKDYNWSVNRQVCCISISVADQDPGSGAFLTPGFGMGKNSDPDPGPGMNIPDQFSESLETVFRAKLLKVFDADSDPASVILLTLDPGSRMEKFGSGIRDKHPGSATLTYSKKYVKQICIVKRNQRY